MPREDLLRQLRAALADRYRVERELGAGGMETVHLARAAERATRDAVLDAEYARHDAERIVRVVVDDRTPWRGDRTGRVIDLHNVRGRRTPR